MKRPPRPVLISFAFETFAEVEDPRIDRTKLHPLMNVLVIALCAVITGASGWEELSLFARAHEAWFRSLFEEWNGPPSADTFRRVFEALDPEELGSAMERWVATVAKSFADEVIAIDGKSLKGAVEKANATVPLHLLHVWAVGQQLLLGQKRVEGAPGEVPAIPEMLKRLKIEGSIVTADANGCTKAVTSAVRDAKADYVLALKGNRGPLHAQVQERFAAAEAKKFRGVPACRSKDKGHGRIETRVVRAMSVADMGVSADWQDLKTIILVDRTRTTSEGTTCERHYYISSLATDVRKIADTIRSHWSVENHLHWTLDVTFGEDLRRIRDKCAAENFATLSRLALMMLKRSNETLTPKSKQQLSVNLKRKKAAWDPRYLGQLLGGR